MTKVKEKMMQWGRYLEKLIKIGTVLTLLTLILTISGIIFLCTGPNIIWMMIFFVDLIIFLSELILEVCISMLKSFKDKSIEFVQKNNFWNIILSNQNFIRYSECMIIAVIGILILRLSSIPYVLFMMFVFWGCMLTSRNIAEFFERRLKD